jgi:hypothetical protein
MTEYEMIENSEGGHPPPSTYTEESYADTPNSVAGAHLGLNSNESLIISEAMVRLEQARLYEMLIKHDMFDGVEANQIALNNVKAELKHFLLERLEVLLGIRQDSLKKENSQPHSSDFNKSEVDFLKMFVKKSLEKIQPITVKQDQPQGLKKIQSEPQQIQRVQITPEQVSKPQKSRPQTNITQKKPSTIEEIALQDLKEMKGRKPVHEMSREELEEHNEKISKKYQASKRPQNAIPMPTAQQTEMLYANQQAKVRGSNEKDSLNKAIANLIMSQKI